MNGVLVIDKPKGPTSHDVVSIVRRLTGAKRVGHLGTLDPGATGVLPLVIGDAAKRASELAGTEKVYEFVMVPGTTTDTDDDEGRVISEAPVTKEQMDRLAGIIPKFVGRIMQRPPQFSAVKVNGVRAYRHARKGFEVKLEPREVYIENLYITGSCSENIKMTLECRSGTYVRSLCRDIGEELGCGAHAKDIRRLRSGRYSIDDAIPLDDLKKRPDLWRSKLIEV